MARIDWKDRIAVNLSINHGEPSVKGMRVPVVVIIASLADGMSAEEIIRQCPQLTQDDIRAALAYAAL